MKPIGIMSKATHRGINGAIFVGYSFSIITKSQAPNDKIATTIIVVTLAIIFGHSIWLSLLNKRELDKDKSLFLLEAIIAPEKPIYRVKCWTNTGEATIPVVPKKREMTSIAGKDTSNRKIIIEKLFSTFL